MEIDNVRKFPSINKVAEDFDPDGSILRVDLSSENIAFSLIIVYLMLYTHSTTKIKRARKKSSNHK